MLRSLVVILLTVVWGGAVAQPKAPPMLCVDGGDCVETETEVDPGNETGVGSYSLASIGSVPFAYSTPIAPTITSEVIVTPATIGANKVNGRRLILSPGDYGDQTFDTQDQEIVFQAGANFGMLTLAAETARLVFRGSPARAGSVGYITVGNNRAGAATDIVFDGINQVHIPQGGEWPRQSNTFNAQRMAVLNSTFLSRDFVAVSYSTPEARLEDAIFANNNMVDEGTNLGGVGAGQATIRLVGAARVIFVDNRLYGTPTDRYQNFRIHANTVQPAEYFYLARNQFEGTGHSFQRSGDGQQSEELLNIWFEDNVQYTSVQPPINVDGSGDGSNFPTTFTMRNNRLYSSTGGWPTIPGGFSWDVSGNTYEPYQEPPAWQFR